MNILIYSLNFSPELTATGKYTGDMAAWFASQGHDVSAIVGMPHYPQWSLFEEYSPPRHLRERINDVDIHRVPHFIPSKSKITTFTRMRMELSFIRNSLRCWWEIMRSKNRYDVVVLVCPPLFTAFYPMIYKFFRGVPWVLHVQDVQIDVAVDLGMIKNRVVIKILRFLERRILKSAALVSTISSSMRKKLESKICINNDVLLVKNWADPRVIKSESAVSSFRGVYGIPQDKYLVMYSGNLGNKQGIEIIIEVAEQLSSNNGLQIVVVGDGAAKDSIVHEVENRKLTNIKFFPVQSEAMLPGMLREADLHLIIQKDEASSTVLPSKLANVLASGRACIVTASDGSELREIVLSNELGMAVEPGDLDALVKAILMRFSDQQESNRMGMKAESYARQNLDMDVILRQFESALESIIVGSA